MPRFTAKMEKQHYESLLFKPKEETKKDRKERLKVQKELIDKVGYQK